MKILHIDSSITQENSISRHLTAEVVSSLKNKHPQAQVQYLDVVAHPIEHLTLDQLTPDNPYMKSVLEADLLVIGAPMYNFSIPSQLKAWLDRIMIAGTSFKYTEDGPVGLLGAKKAIVVSTRGGIYDQEFQESLLITSLQFMGIESAVIRSEGMAISEDIKVQSVQQAELDVQTKTSIFSTSEAVAA